MKFYVYSIGLSFTRFLQRTKNKHIRYKQIKYTCKTFSHSHAPTIFPKKDHRALKFSLICPDTNNFLIERYSKIEFFRQFHSTKLYKKKSDYTNFSRKNFPKWMSFLDILNHTGGADLTQSRFASASYEIKGNLLF